MSDNSTIEWTEATWNPLTGCTKVSPGCDHCYAETFAERFRGVPGHHFEQGFDLTLRPERLTQPLRWRKPRRIFVNSMSDLFHQDVPDDYIARVFAVMASASKHTFQLLTKRHARMRSLLSSEAFYSAVTDAVEELWTDGALPEEFESGPWWPLPNVWLGVSVEDQHWADIRLPALLATPAAVRWISAEPLLGPVHLPRFCACGCRKPLAQAKQEVRVNSGWMNPDQADAAVPVTLGLDWVVVGGESGLGARPMHPDWARSLRDQCTAAGVPFLFKQWGAWAPTGRLGVGIHLKPNCQRDLNYCYAGAPFATELTSSGHEIHYSPEMRRVGKGKAGRELDGRTWDEYPRVAA